MARQRRRGFGSLRRLPSSRYQAEYTGPDLARYTAPRTFQAKVDAEGWLISEHDLLSTGQWTPPLTRLAIATTHVEHQRRYLTDYAESWLEDRTLKPRTTELYRKLGSSDSPGAGCPLGERNQRGHGPRMAPAARHRNTYSARSRLQSAAFDSRRRRTRRTSALEPGEDPWRRQRETSAQDPACIASGASHNCCQRPAAVPVDDSLRGLVRDAVR